MGDIHSEKRRPHVKQDNANPKHLVHDADTQTRYRKWSAKSDNGVLQKRVPAFFMFAS
jgi:hypothetical protein